MRKKFVFGALALILLLASVLRFYKIDQIPHGLYIDEVSIGYNAYTILKTGKDEYGVTTPLFFKAFGEYKMPVEIYLTSFSMAVFGKNEFALRFPSAFFGTLTVLLLYFLVKMLLRKESVAVLSAFLLAITPWHIQFSRAGFEANIALFFYLLGGVLFLSFLKNKRYLWLISSILSFIVTAYTYNAYKLIVPITLLFIFYKSFYMLKTSRNKLAITAIFVIVLLLPLFLFSGGNSRFLDTLAFSKETPVFAYPVIYIQNYLSFFSFPFLFVTGDGIGRHSIVGMGPLFRWELPFLLIGLFALFKEKKTLFTQVIFFLLLIAPTTAALTRPSPHLLRSFLLVIPLTVVIAYGVIFLWEKKKTLLKTLLVLVGFVALYEFGFYLHLYYEHYPRRTALDWGASYKEVIMDASKFSNRYSKIIISNKMGMIHPYRNFYNDKLIYTFDYSPEKAPKTTSKILFISSNDPQEIVRLNEIPHTLLETIYLPGNKDIFAQFWEL